jgi:hypothetical protein
MLASPRAGVSRPPCSACDAIGALREEATYARLRSLHVVAGAELRRPRNLPTGRAAIKAAAHQVDNARQPCVGFLFLNTGQ